MHSRPPALEGAPAHTAPNAEPETRAQIASLQEAGKGRLGPAELSPARLEGGFPCAPGMEVLRLLTNPKATFHFGRGGRGAGGNVTPVPPSLQNHPQVVLEGGVPEFGPRLFPSLRHHGQRVLSEPQSPPPLKWA